MKKIVLKPIKKYDERWYELYSNINFLLRTQPDQTDDSMIMAADFISEKIDDYHRNIKMERFNLWKSLIGKYYKITKHDGSFYIFPYHIIKENQMLFTLYSKCDRFKYESGISTRSFDILTELNCDMVIEEVDEREMIDNAINGINEVVKERKRKIELYSNE